MEVGIHHPGGTRSVTQASASMLPCGKTPDALAAIQLQEKRILLVDLDQRLAVDLEQSL